MYEEAESLNEIAIYNFDDAKVRFICEQSYIPETMQLDRIDCNADPRLTPHNFGLMQTLLEASLLFHFLGGWQANVQLILIKK